MKIIPEYKDDTDKIIMLTMTACTLFACLFSPLVVILAFKDNMTSQSYDITKALLNYEIFLALISLIAIVPIVGWIIGIFLIPILYIWNVIVIILTLCALVKKSEVNIPVPYAFI